MLVVSWRHQNKNISFFNYWVILLLDKPLMTWIYEDFVEGAICEPKKINFFFGSDINCLWLKLRANKPMVTLALDTRWRNQNGSIFFGYEIFLVSAVVGENIDDLKFNTFLGGREGRGIINKTIITLKINLWKRH